MKMPVRQRVLALLDPLLMAFSNFSVILTLHRAGSAQEFGLWPNENLKVSAETLSDFVQQARRSGWQFISMDEIGHGVRKGKVPSRCIAMTFDDGYRDNFTEAYPALRALSVPFCVYLTTGLIDGTTSPWWLDLEDVLLSNRRLQAPNGDTLACETLEQKCAAFRQLKKDFLSESPRWADSARSWLDKLHADLPPSRRRTGEMLSWDEVRCLANDELVTLGAHTVSHRVLSSLEERDVQQEMAESKQRIESETGRMVEHFAYPYGSSEQAGDREFRLAKTSRFMTAVTTMRGVVGPTGCDLHALPRVTMMESNASLEQIVSRFSRGQVREQVKRWLPWRGVRSSRAP